MDETLKTAQELAQVIAYCMQKKYIAGNAEKIDANQSVVVAAADPFVQVADMFGAPKDYHKALAKMDEAFIAGILKEAKMDKKATVKIKSHIALGAEKTEIIVKLK